jgi:tRNA 2-thiocytidine biosynthesis protein TtcA
MTSLKNLKKLEKKLLKGIGTLNRQYGLIRPGDLIIVGVSGGKDSLALILLMDKLRKRAPFEFKVLGVTLNIGMEKSESDAIAKWMESHGIEWELLATNIPQTIDAVVEVNKSPCSACARFRRGILYNYVYERRGVLALGHHMDDTIETLLMNIFFSGKTQAIPPVLISDDGRNRLIRPMLFCREKNVGKYAVDNHAPIVGTCSCPGAAWISSSQRQKMKELIAKMENDFPDTARHLLSSIGNIKPSNLLDNDIFDFLTLKTTWETDSPKTEYWKSSLKKEELSDSQKNNSSDTP